VRPNIFLETKLVKSPNAENLWQRIGREVNRYRYREGGKLILHQNRIFATPSTPHPGQPKPNPAYLDQ
jgi:hypothetical protein